MSGFIKLHRQITDWEWYSDANVSRLFFHLLLTVNFKNKRWKGRIVERGSRLFGRDQLAKETGLTIQETRTALNKLKSTNEITIKTSSQGSEVQVVNYQKYQSLTNELTNDQPATNQRLTNNQPLKKKDKKDKKDNIGVFLPPSLNDVVNYFKEKGYQSNVAEKAYNYYEANNWTDSKGNQVKNWKQKMIGVWFKDENKETQRVNVSWV